MTAVRGHTIVPVKDPEAWVEFYAKALGFHYDGRVGMNDVFAAIR